MSPPAYKPRLLAPGPVEVPPQVLAAMAQPVIHHRTEAFKALFLEVRRQLARIAKVEDDVLVLAGSGTAGFEAGLLAAVPAGSKLIGVNAGKFGERWVRLAEHYGYHVVEVPLAWGTAAGPEHIAPVLEAHPDAAALVTTHSETSTGALHKVEEIAEYVHETSPNTMLLVDAVTSLAAAPLHPLEWGLDGVFSGSQKGLMTPPGLAFAWLSERAWRRTGPLNPSFYLDLRKERELQASGQTAYTPSLSLIRGLRVACEMLLSEGVEEVWTRRDMLNRALIAGAVALGCEPFAERPSPAVAALRAPKGVAAPDIVSGLAARGLRIAGGQDQAKPVLIRPSVLGYADSFDAISLVSGLEMVLRDLGRTVDYGQGVARAMACLDG